MNEDLPSGKRMFELAADAIRIEGASDFYESADRILIKLDPVEKRFFQVLLGPDYIAPDKRGKYWRDLPSAGKEVIGPDTLRDLLLNGDSMSLEEAQKAIDDHIKKQCLAIENGRWPGSEEDPLPSYYERPTYPSPSDDYDSRDWSVDIMAFEVLEAHKAVLRVVYQTGQGEFQPKGETRYHLVAKFSTQGTRWAIASFYLDDFEDRFNRTEIVESFDSLEQASAWLKSVAHKIERSTGSGQPHYEINSSAATDVDQSTSFRLRLRSLLRTVPEIKPASERVLPALPKEITHDIEMEL